MDRALATFRLGAAASRLLPLDTLTWTADRAGAVAGPRLLPARADQLRRNIERTGPIGPERARELARRGFGSYGRYWAESFRIPGLGVERIDRGFSFEGYGHIERVLASGVGPILVLPHLGGWEWAAAWLARVIGVGVTAVVERLEPPEVYDWFVGLRSAYGVNVIPLGPGAMVQLTAAVKRGDVVCLLADRDIGGNGLDVAFFGERTSLPVGPALLARRTGAPLLPTAVYFRGRQRVGVVTAPIAPGQGRGRDENERLTRAVADRLEALIARAPEQWHLLEANWPADRGDPDPVARPHRDPLDRRR
jgi:KDO2-lipid IV(A) lauroyltransferase